jgi:hypothetical protein
MIERDSKSIGHGLHPQHTLTLQGLYVWG